MWYAIIAIIFLTIGFSIGRYFLPYDGELLIDTNDPELGTYYRFNIDRLDVTKRNLILRIRRVRLDRFAKNTTDNVDNNKKEVMQHDNNRRQNL